MVDSDTSDSLRKYVDSPRNHCFVCSGTNPYGLHLRFSQDAGLVTSSFVPERWHEGWEHIVHGGILASVLDEAMAYTLFFTGILAMTAKLEIRYKLPVYRGDKLDIEARIERDTRKLAFVAASIVRARQVVAEAYGTFIKLRPLETVYQEDQ